MSHYKFLAGKAVMETIFYQNYDNHICREHMQSSKFAQAITLNLGQETDYPDWGLSWFSSAPPYQYQDNAST
jgi:hypothetical protein